MTRSTSVTRLVRAPRERVYAALVEADSIARWKAPDGMICRIDDWDGRAFRVTLTYESSAQAGKTTERTDTYRGRFVELVPGERVVEVDEFETDDPDLQGPMTITIALADAVGGTEVTGVHEGLPPGVTVADNELGWRQALARLAALVESA